MSGSASLEERARLFVALELPARVRESLAGWPVGVSDGLRLVRVEDLHVTLCFLGWQPASVVSAVLDACSVVAGLPAVRLVVGEGIWLPPRRPRVLAASLEDDTGGLVAVQRALSDSLSAGGWYTPEKRPFLAHVTVARVGSRGRAPRTLHDPAPPRHAFIGSRVTLFRSRLSAAGARYEPLGTVELGG